MGEPIAAIDDDSFRAAADTFFAEGLGLCAAWQFEGPIEDMLSGIQDHSGSIIDQDPITGLWRIKPLRADYNPGALPVFGPAEIISVDDYQRASVGELVTSIAVTYRDVYTFKDRTTPPLRDLALIQEQGAENLEKRDYPWLPTMSIAMRIADRDMQLATLPLYTASVRLTRAAYGVKPGDVIKISDARIGVVSGIVRVLAVDYGTLQDGTITARVAEDRFGLAASVYADQQPIDYTPPDTRALPPEDIAAIEVPFYVLAQPDVLGAAAAVLPVLQGYAAGLAAAPSVAAQSYEVFSGLSADALTDAGDGDFVYYARLDSPLAQTGTTLTLTNATPSPDDVELLDNVEVGSLAVLGTGTAAEWLQVIAVDADAGTVEVSRGALDTTPALADWPGGTPVWFDDGRLGFAEFVRTDGDLVFVAFGTQTESDALTAETSPTATVTLDQRAARPYPPGNVLINAEAYPVTIARRADHHLGAPQPAVADHRRGAARRRHGLRARGRRDLQRLRL